MFVNISRGWLLFAGLLLMASVLSACNSNSEPETDVTATPTLAPQVIIVPTVTPVDNIDVTSPPTEVVEPVTENRPVETAAIESTIEPAIQSTVTPTVEATAIPTLAAIPTLTTAPTRVALVRYRDNLYARAGDFTILSSNFPVAPAGNHYDLWLTLDGQPRFRLGSIPSNETQLNFTAAADQNLLSIYDGAILSLEPDVNTPGEMGPTVMAGTVSPNALRHIRYVAVRFADNPNEVGFLIGAEQQMALANEHAGFIRNEIAAGNLDGARRHTEHVINILNGEGGELFGDLDGDGLPQNPGDGIGVAGYINGAKEQTELVLNGGNAIKEMKLHAGHVLISSDNALAWLEEAIDTALRILAADTAAEAAPNVTDLAIMLEQINDGVDVDGDGVIVPIVGEGGLVTAYEHTLNMGAIELFPLATDNLSNDVAAKSVEIVLQATATSTATTLPEALPAPAEKPTATPAPLGTVAAAEATIDIVDFAFGKETVTVQVGTTVIWHNMGSAPHTVTADDGSFHTEIFQPGESRTVTAQSPGIFPYYCELHGGASGQGMSAVLIVEE